MSGYLLSSYSLACQGTLELSGGDLGCQALVQEPYVISLKKCNFTSIPEITLNGVTTDLGKYDSVSATVDDVTKTRLTVIVTTRGRHGNEVCARTALVWRAEE
ncbi:hypothetical protein PL263_19595 [Methylomonas sp. EFPC3]|uniref:hypothetical protein n=1 Tax=Methylomonas sp. EFPC3 TaxID=3021710 RepID=UPI0024162424|nr:hypothetical protein [Methylomonas sp. EFPC3]WFP50283.1 hypothetical protein PL263_19595 [Methylomonas sp. EFPC3]